MRKRHTIKVLNSPPMYERVSSYFLNDRTIDKERLDLRRKSDIYSVALGRMVGVKTYLWVG
jgi:hypothetical protein